MTDGAEHERDAVRRVGLELTAMWAARGRNEQVTCLRCRESRVALVIGESCYRWSCVDCGWQSPWFRFAGNAVRIVGGSTIRFVGTALPSPRAT